MTYASPNHVKEFHVHIKYGKPFQAVNLFPVRKAPLNVFSNYFEICFPLRDYYCKHEKGRFKTFTSYDLKEVKKTVYPASQEEEWNEAALCHLLTASRYKQVPICVA